jgi:hypothetical protein
MKNMQRKNNNIFFRCIFFMIRLLLWSATASMHGLRRAGARPGRAGLWRCEPGARHSHCLPARVRGIRAAAPPICSVPLRTESSKIHHPLRPQPPLQIRPKPAFHAENDNHVWRRRLGARVYVSTSPEAPRVYASASGICERLGV